MSIARSVMEQPGRYSIQQLQQAMERGILPAYVAIPLIQEKVQMQKQFQQQQALQQPPVSSMPPIAQQVMQEADQMEGGVEQLPSNLPENYSGGGILAFDQGGEVESYEAGGVVALAGGGDPMAKGLNTGSFSPAELLAREELRQRELQRLREIAARDRAILEQTGGGRDFTKEAMERVRARAAAAEAARTAGPAAEGAAAAEAGAAEAGAARAASGPSKFQTIRQALQPKSFNPVLSLPSGAGISGLLRSGAQLARGVGAYAIPYLGGTAAVNLGFTNEQGIPTEVAREYYGMQLKPGEEPSFMGDVAARGRAILGLVNPLSTDKEGLLALKARKEAEYAAAAKANAGPTPPKEAGEGAEGYGGMGGRGLPSTGGAANFGDIYSQIRAATQEDVANVKKPTDVFRENIAQYLSKSGQIEDLRAAQTERYRDQLAASGEALQGFEKQLQKDEQERGAEKDQAKAMAIFKAGLAMMAGTSPRALENIGKGAMVGAEDWQKASADIKKAEKEHRLMMAHIEEARRAEKRGDIKERIAEVQSAAEREQNRNQFIANGLIAAGISEGTQAYGMIEKQVGAAANIAVGRDKGDVALLKQALGQGRGLTEVEIAKLLQQQQDKYPLSAAKRDLLAIKGWKEAPKAGKDKEDFDEELAKFYKTKLYTLANLPYSTQTDPAFNKTTPDKDRFKQFENLSR